MVFLHMINHNLCSEMIRKIKLLILILILHSNQGLSQTREIGGTGDFVDGIAAIVNDGVVLRSEVEDQVTMPEEFRKTRCATTTHWTIERGCS